MEPQIIADRLEKLAALELDHGNHPSFDAGHCAMEAVAWLAGEPHSDAPACACPVIARAVIRLNDRISDKAMRTELLRPLLPKIVGTRASREVMIKRGYIAADMAVRVFAPMALEKRGRLDLAEKLRGLTEVTDQASARAARDVAWEVRKLAAAAAAAAAYATYAAATYAAAAADAADAAAAAADAADGYAYARRPVYEQAVKMIERMIDVKEGPNANP